MTVDSIAFMSVLGVLFGPTVAVSVILLLVHNYQDFLKRTR